MLTYLKNKLRNENIKKRLTIVFVAVISIFIAGILLISNVVLYWSIIPRMEKEFQTNCEIIAMQLQGISNNATICLKTLTKDINRIYKGDTVFGTDKMEPISTVNAINTVLEYERFCFPDINSLIFAGEDQTVVISGKLKEGGQPSYEEIYDLIEQIPKKGLADIQELTTGDFSIFMDGEPVWILAHRVIDMNTGKNLGYLLAVIFSDTLSRYFPEKDDMGYLSEYQLLNEEGKIIASKNKESLLQSGGDEKFMEKIQKEKAFRLQEKKGSYLVTSCSVGAKGWQLVNRIEMKELTKEIQLLFAIIIAAGLAGIFISVIVISRIANWITRPIQDLTETAQQFRRENKNIRCTVTTTDEVGVLGEVFNNMLERIERQMEDIRREQRQKRQYELALLQAQIKPHFLYNTLDLIYISCQMNRPKDGARVAKAMADYYRTSLSSGQEIITIADEVKNISNYLLIQKERYNDKIDFSITVDQDIYLYVIPKMTFQPLVENAIYHGLKSCPEKGNVYVKGWQEGAFLCLIVEDDGAGMTEEMKAAALENPDDNNGHFGLTSVNRRIQLYYGMEYGLKIQSAPGKGTKIEIRIPKKEVEQC